MSAVIEPTTVAAEPVEAGASVSPDVLYEVIDGQIVELPHMGSRQEVFTEDLQVELGAFTRDKGLGRWFSETLFDFTEQLGRKRRPDLSFVSAKTWPRDQEIPDQDGWPVVPEIAVEVISKSNSWEDTYEKIEEYFTVGVKRVWVITLRHRKVHVFKSPSDVKILTPEDVLEDSELLPEFQLVLADIMPPPAPTAKV